MEITVNWQGGMAFAGSNGSTNTIMDAGKKYGGLGSGPSPMETLLMSLGGCTGMDSISILRKVKDKLDAFDIHIDAKRQPTHPKVFREITLTFRFQGDDALRDVIIDAVTRSQNKYCAISAMLAKGAPVHYHILLNGVQIHSAVAHENQA